MQTKNILLTGCAKNLENTLCLLPDPFFLMTEQEISFIPFLGSDPFISDPSKLHELGWKHAVELEDGIKMMYTWYVDN